MSVRQEEFLFAQDKRVNILTGSVRSGKTWASLMKWVLFVLSQPKTADFLMAGNTVGTLERNCLSLLSEIAGDNFSYSTYNMRGELFGRRIWIMGAGDSASEGRIRGMTLAGAYLDELTLLRREFFMTLLSRLSLPGALVYATTNPDGPGHWVMKDVMKCPEIDAAVWEFYITDNIFLPAEYVEAIKREYAGVFYERYILGLWTACEGIIYKEFVEAEMLREL